MNRCSGILMPVFYLPSPYGIGTLGKAAYDFADFLHAAVSHYVVGSGVNEFVFHGTAAAVQNEYFHFLWVYGYVFLMVSNWSKY